jgi:urease accessory protein
MTPRIFVHQLASAILVAALVVLASDAALAHTGAEHVLSFAAGFKHPFTGFDHMLAMVAVGLWAGLNGGRALWAWPVAFVSVMLLGGALGISGIALPMVEAGILASVVVLGLLVLAAVRLPVAVGAILVAAFALLHGHAHGAELPANAAAVTYAAGFAAATAILHAFGIEVAHLAGSANGRLAVRGAGALVAAAGVALAVV